MRNRMFLQYFIIQEKGVLDGVKNYPINGFCKVLLLIYSPQV
jgi:hypothetical protein